ncbi:hypothetical protein D1T48_gp07 [Thermoproteus tenax virus 1]|uniref:Coat protein TP1 n=1 Tax=Thermoproteus tenax virus 1 (strain KRA1) TaxID=10480 RepID=COA1_TTV1K|nr:hypothetical protein D1T48_gp07 [Thermoproteus tenax virus 1]P19270.1 RecName: Full=Coat protein TP1 [Thermoproteus tenax virus 1 (STRAIN KRA1)]CAA32974.1 unnamed protein product [Thermoproteus tenax virus 1]
MIIIKTKNREYTIDENKEINSISAADTICPYRAYRSYHRKIPIKIDDCKEARKIAGSMTHYVILRQLKEQGCETEKIVDPELKFRADAICDGDALLRLRQTSIGTGMRLISGN